MSTVRLITDPPAPGAWNMAVDEALLESAAERGIATLRLYRWSEPTLSLGYFQRAADREQHSASRACPLVRRASGGGAIVHDRELTYSLAIPQLDVRARAATELYEAVHGILIDGLASFSLAAEAFRGAGAADEQNSMAGPFLCFQRRAEGDIVLAGAKIVGSAQRRRRGAVLQHGSILLSQSPFAPELPGLKELGAPLLDEGAFAARWLELLCERLSWSLEPARLTAEESSRALELADGRFQVDSYSYRR
jgi:lipoate-protein ligase A